MPKLKNEFSNKAHSPSKPTRRPANGNMSFFGQPFSEPPRKISVRTQYDPAIDRTHWGAAGMHREKLVHTRGDVAGDAQNWALAMGFAEITASLPDSGVLVVCGANAHILQRAIFYDLPWLSREIPLAVDLAIGPVARALATIQAAQQSYTSLFWDIALHDTDARHLDAAAAANLKISLHSISKLEISAMVRERIDGLCSREARNEGTMQGD